MFKFVVNRLLYTVLVLIAVGFVIFTLLYLSPDNPAQFKLGNTASASDIRCIGRAPKAFFSTTISVFPSRTFPISSFPFSYASLFLIPWFLRLWFLYPRFLCLWF